MATVNAILRTWEFWKLVACIFTFSFLLQLISLIALYSNFAAVSRCSDSFAQCAYCMGESALRHSYSKAMQNSPSPITAAAAAAPTGSACGSEAKMSSTTTDNTDAVEKIPNSLKPTTFGHYPYVHFTTYRASPKTLYAVGLTSVVMRAFDRPVYTCAWRKRGKNTNVTETEAGLIYVPYDENRMPYATMIVNCTFPEPVDSRDANGTLSLAVSMKSLRSQGPVQVEVFEEEKGEGDKFESRMVKNAAAPPYKYAFCGPPMFGRLRADWILSWLVYHYDLWEGKVKFFFYNYGGLTNETTKVLEPFITSGELEIIDVLDAWMYPAHYDSQVLLINDCLQRTRFLSQWTFFQDFDEFLHVPAPNSLQKLLEQHRDKPWLTWASVKASTELCKPPSSPDRAWPEVERMMWSEKQPECKFRNDVVEDAWLCIGPRGRRKYVVNPRKVVAIGVHIVVLEDKVATSASQKEKTQGLHFHGSIARLLHYRGALSSNGRLCGKLTNATANIEGVNNATSYNYDASLAAALRSARERNARRLPL